MRTSEKWAVRLQAAGVMGGALTTALAGGRGGEVVVRAGRRIPLEGFDWPAARPWRPAVINTRGRASGLPHTVEVMALASSTCLFVVSCLGTSSDWYRNVRANPLVTVEDEDGLRSCVAIPVVDPGTQKALLRSASGGQAGRIARAFSLLARTVPLRMGSPLVVFVPVGREPRGEPAAESPGHQAGHHQAGHHQAGYHQAGHHQAGMSHAGPPYGGTMQGMQVGSGGG